jgi:hypothetical protein
VTPLVVIPYPIAPEALRPALEAALGRVLEVADHFIAALDALDGDPDIEGTCEDEGCDSDREREEGW